MEPQELKTKLKESLSKILDAEQVREELAKLCSDILNSDAYNQLPLELLDFIDDLVQMHESEGIKEPKILHMDAIEIKAVLERLEKAGN